MDVLLLFMGLTLAAAGVLLIRDYSRALYSSYTARGRVVNIEPGYWPKALLPQGYPRDQRLPAYFPVIEYYWNGESSRFTALMPEASTTLQVDELVDVQVSRSRRRHSRVGHSMLVLVALLGCSLLLLALAGLAGKFDRSQVILVSLVLAVCFFILVLYLRQQDESLLPVPLPSSGAMSLRLQEPTAPSHWRNFRVSRHQRTRIIYSRLFGSGCVAAGILFVLSSLDMPHLEWGKTVFQQARAGDAPPHLVTVVPERN